ncbi:hypothetical protein KIN20_032141 [Parelaphostrongylus tenuis]|uniref:Uncharacterized protein n=1 Tax=Parelaphostrongylus tenuis TaxID=148309 RepID=A0AAD5R899_PARTN|nr:hypothetical protein KIN20_032141 [Parelaphostrongylus tenuis]
MHDYTMIVSTVLSWRDSTMLFHGKEAIFEELRELRNPQGTDYGETDWTSPRKTLYETDSSMTIFDLWAVPEHLRLKAVLAEIERQSI